MSIIHIHGGEHTEMFCKFHVITLTRNPIFLQMTENLGSVAAHTLSSQAKASPSPSSAQVGNQR